MVVVHVQVCQEVLPFQEVSASISRAWKTRAPKEICKIGGKQSPSRMTPRVLGSLQVCHARVGDTQCLGIGVVCFSLVFLYVGPKFFQGKLPLCSWNLANKAKANIANAMAAEAQVQHMEDVKAQGVDGHTRRFAHGIADKIIPRLVLSIPVSTTKEGNPGR